MGVPVIEASGASTKVAWPGVGVNKQEVRMEQVLVYMKGNQLIVQSNSPCGVVAGTYS